MKWRPDIDAGVAYICIMLALLMVFAIWMAGL